MDFRAATRGQSIQIGAVLLFGILVISLASYQAFLVPQENREIEFNAYQAAQNDLTQLRSAIVESGTTGTESVTEVQLGTTYPARIVAMNPPPPSGQLSTGDPRDVTFENVTAVESEATNTRTYWNVTATKTFENETKGILYRPGFNEFRGESVGVTGENAYVVGDPNPVRIGPQSLISGSRIRYVFVQGELSAGGQSASVSSSPRSLSGRSVTVTGQDGPLTMQFDPPPGVTADGWVDGIGQRLVDANDNIIDVTNSTGDVRIRLNGSRTYNLRLGSVLVSSQDRQASDQSPRYIIAQDGDDQSVVSGQRATVTAEVRDAYNNPVDGTSVRFNVTQGSARLFDENDEPVSGARTTETDAEGRATMSLIVEGADKNVIVNASVVDGTGQLNATEFEVQVSQAPGSQTGAGAYLISISDAQSASPDGSGKGMQFTIANEDENRDMTITRYEVEDVTTNMERFDRDGSASAVWDRPMTLDIGNDSTVEGFIDENQLQIGTEYELDSQATLQPGEQAVIRDWESAQPGGDMTGDFARVKIWFQMEGSTDEVSATTTLFFF